ncbi:MAG TPA: cytochrome b/b6 domain-containing protein [Usitatibacter sp.]|jgi:cytochrome b|nr:cytochrome b/b6 domain-containing protein [Usitatibacter sp.]
MVRVWDLPTRLFHWALALAFAGDWLTRDASRLDFHEFLGYAIGGLVLFRLAWGWLGTRWARFSSFPLSAAAAWRYFRGMLGRGRDRHVGHNPAGSWAIYMLLTLAALQVVTGVVALGAEQHLGPLAGVPSFALGDAAHAAHRILAYAMLAVVGVHVGGVLVGTFLERENLVGSMLTGRKHAPASDGVPARGGVAGVMIALLAVSAFAWFAGGRADARMQRAIAALALPRDPRWQSECSGCHLAYHPSLLPARSWQRLFSGQHQHFGEDLDLADEAVRQLEDYAVRNAADTRPSPVAWRIARSVDTGSAPLRISETAYWRARHERLDPALFKSVHASDCGACHRDADSASFSALAIRVPEGPPPARGSK